MLLTFSLVFQWGNRVDSPLVGLFAVLNIFSPKL